MKRINWVFIYVLVFFCTSAVAQQERVIRDTYAKLDTYNAAAQAMRNELTRTPFRSAANLRFELGDFRSGDVKDILHKPYVGLVTMPAGDVISLTSGGHVQDGGTAHPMLNNMTTFVADPTQLGTADALPREIAALAAWVRASPADPGAAEPISLPGEPERRIAARRGRDGIPLPARTHEQLAAVAAGVGVGPPR